MKSSKTKLTPAPEAAPTLTNMLDQMAYELVQKWAQENSKKVWLGGPSRKSVQADVAMLLRKSYNLAKERYS
jgi:hypothetical protein